MIDPEELRFGSGGFADTGMIAGAGLYRSRGGLFVGYDEMGRKCFSSQQSGVLLSGGARCGKGNLIIPWLVDGHYPENVIISDWKGQNGVVAQLQVRQGRRVVNFNPRKRRGVAAHRVNPVPYIKGNSPTLIPDTKLFTQSWIPFSGSSNAEYFEGSAQRITEAVTVTLAQLKGSVTLPVLADKMAGLGAATEEWLSFEYEMTQSQLPSVREVAEDLKTWRKQGNDGSGFKGIKNEIAKAFSCMSDPQLREALSPPFDFCFSELTQEGGPPFMVNIMEDQEFATTSGPVIKALYTCALIYKRRALGSRPQLWCLDELGNIGAWPLAVGLFTYGAGYGIRPVAIVQSTAQLENLAPRASEIIPNSCGTQIFMGVRSVREAALVSKMIGTQTLEYDDFVLQERARAAHKQAVASVFLEGADPYEAMLGAVHHERLAQHRTKQARDVRTLDEVMNEKQGRAFVFMPGVLEKPLLVQLRRYWHRRDLAGRYLGDPFHSPPGRVEIATWRGQVHRSVITETVPDQYADWPQYRSSGQWSYVQGFRP